MVFDLLKGEQAALIIKNKVLKIRRKNHRLS